MQTGELLTLLNLLFLLPVTAGSAVLVYILKCLHAIERRLTRIEYNGQH
jgi:hypothetical protein